MRPLLALLLVSAVVWAQAKPAPEAQKPKKPKAGDIQIPDPGARIEDSSVASREVARFQTAFKAAKTQKERLEALEALGRWDHPLVLKAAARLLRDRDWKVAVKAAVVCARQASCKGKAGKTLLGALKREKRTNVACAELVGMGRLGFRSRSSIRVAIKYIRRDTTETHKAATRYLGYIKYKEGFRLLAEFLDEPAPKRPDDPKNPPASYWKARWYEWDSNVPYTRWALSQFVPGETFETRREAKEWAETEGRKYGIKW